MWLGGALSDRVEKKNRAAYALTPAVCFLVALPFFYAAMNTTSLTWAFRLFLVPTRLSLAWLGPVFGAVQHLAPASMRTISSSLFLLINNLLGIAVGLWIFGYISDRLTPRYGAESMRHALYYGAGFYLLASLLLWFASRPLAAVWVEGCASRFAQRNAIKAASRYGSRAPALSAAVHGTGIRGGRPTYW